MIISEIYDYSKVKRLDQIKRDKDVRHITKAIYPGFHCPLFTATNIFISVEKLAVLIIGTEECTYYTKCLRGTQGEYKIFSLVLDKQDITFGFSKGLLPVINKIKSYNQFEALAIITTCVVELIGEEICSIIDKLNKDDDFKTIIVKTNHYQIDTPTIGLENGLIALVSLMEKHETIDGTVNILGPKQDGFEGSELFGILDRNGIKINTRIPDTCNIRTLSTATSAQVNIVTNTSALGIARKMKDEFGIDYVYFDTFSDPDRINQSYQSLEKILNINISVEIDELYHQVLSEMSRMRPVTQGKTFIFAMPPMLSYEISSFLCRTGMKPLWLQTLGLRVHDDEYIKEILSMGHNPRVCRAINKIPLDEVNRSEKPDIYFSSSMHTYHSTNGPEVITLHKELVGRGFEIPLNILKRLSVYFEKKAEK